MLPLTAVFVAAALIGWWAGSRLLATALEARQRALIERTAELLASGRFPLTPELLERVALLIDAHVLLLDAAGRPLMVTPALSGDPPAGLDSGETRMKIAGEPQLAATRPIAAAADPRAARLVVVTSLSDLHQAVGQAALALGVAALLATFLLSWLAHRLAAGITRPLQDLAVMAGRIAAGERELRTPAPGAPREVVALADGLNDMVQRLRQYEAEAARQARLAGLGAMAARVAHEVRNPLTAIRMQLQLLEEDLPAERRAGVAALLDETRRLALLVDGIVDHGRPLTLRPRPTDLNLLADEVCALFAPQMRHRRIQLSRRTDAALPALDLDPDRTRQMLVNLLVNARDALPGSGRILVRTASDGDAAILAVHDSGPGLSPQRLDAILSGREQASGYGLCMTAELATAQQAALRAVPGILRGAALELRFPLRPSPATGQHP